MYLAHYPWQTFVTANAGSRIYGALAVSQETGVEASRPTGGPNLFCHRVQRYRVCPEFEDFVTYSELRGFLLALPFRLEEVAVPSKPYQ